MSSYEDGYADGYRMAWNQLYFLSYLTKQPDLFKKYT